MNKLNSLAGSLNVITGCGSGLGKATLNWFLRHGSGPILAIDRKFEDNFVEGLGITKGSDNLMIRQHDTFDEEKTSQSINEFVSKFGRIDNLINVAGVALSFGLYTESKEFVYNSDHADTLLKFNTYGTFNMIRSVAKHMIGDSLKEEDKTRTKCIINTGSICTHSPNPGHSFLAASNAAIESMTLCLAREFSPFGIRCNTINVGYFDTKLMRLQDKKVQVWVANEVSLCPRRLGDPSEFAHLVEKIVENQMINGCCIRLDSGSRDLPLE